MKIGIKWRAWDQAAGHYRITAVEVDAYPCGVPGLAIHASVDGADWSVTHVRSGLVVAIAGDPETALSVVRALDDLMSDWTISADDIADEVTTFEVIEAVSPVGGWVDTRRPVDRRDFDDLVAMS